MLRRLAEFLVSDLQFLKKREEIRDLARKLNGEKDLKKTVTTVQITPHLYSTHPCVWVTILAGESGEYRFGTTFYFSSKTPKDMFTGVLALSMAAAQSLSDYERFKPIAEKYFKN